jgi:hypothetical protein
VPRPTPTFEVSPSILRSSSAENVTWFVEDPAELRRRASEQPYWAAVGSGDEAKSREIYLRGSIYPPEAVERFVEVVVGVVDDTGSVFSGRAGSSVRPRSPTFRWRTWTELSSPPCTTHACAGVAHTAARLSLSVRDRARSLAQCARSAPAASPLDQRAAYAELNGGRPNDGAYPNGGSNDVRDQAPLSRL